MTPGKKPIRVSSRLIQNLPDKPYCKATPNGGSKMARTIDNNDIMKKNIVKKILRVQTDLRPE